jgi:hypothetical protein
MPETARVVTTDREIDAAIRRARVFEKYDRRVKRAAFSERTDRLVLSMDNGVTHMIPRSLLQGLTAAGPRDLEKIELLGGGTGLYWPALDVAHYVPGLLAGVYGSEKWMKQLQRLEPVPFAPERSRARNAGPRSAPRRANGRRRDADLPTPEKRRKA